MSRLSELMGMCKHIITININPHREEFLTVEQYLGGEGITAPNEDDLESISSDMRMKMVEGDAIAVVQAYPDNSVGSYVVYHYDIDMAIEEVITAISEKYSKWN